MTDCQYCNLKPWQDNVIVTGCYTELRIKQTNDGHTVMYAVGDDDTDYFYPRFCPKCGRKLNEDIYDEEDEEE